jgi:hypothetical protein
MKHYYGIENVKLNNIRQDSVNTVVAKNEAGEEIIIANADGEEIKLYQLSELKQGRDMVTVAALGMVAYNRTTQKDVYV